MMIDEEVRSKLFQLEQEIAALKLPGTLQRSALKGLDGKDGSPGPKGDTGNTGPAGNTGLQGPAGDNGAPGVGVPGGGTTGQVLAKASATDYATEWVTPSGGGAITYAAAALAADVALTTSNIWYDGPSLSLAAGTWLVTATAHMHRAATTAANITMRIGDGTSHYASAGQYHASVSGINVQLATQAVIVLASTTTVKIQMTTSNGNANAKMKAAIVANASGNNATQIVAVKLA